MPPPFLRGQVLNAPVLDPQGRNPKVRPCVVIGCKADFVAVVAITSTVGDVAPADRIDLPFSPNPSSPCHTGLTRPSAANCAWQTTVRVEDVEEVIGRVDDADFRRIYARCAELVAQRLAQPPAEPPPPKDS
jgi:hypothetical protein